MPDKETILVAEDERPLAKALALKLADAGFKVRIVTDGLQAIDALKLESFSLVLMDLVMPKVDGFGILEYIRNSQLKVPVVVLSNLSQQETRDRVFRMGAVDYYVKADIELSEIVERVKKLLGY